MIYLDWNAATPPEPSILEEVARKERELWANPSSPHALGRRARAEIESAREVVAAMFGVEPGGVTFTASGTEALNLAARLARGHALVSAVEHKALLEPLREAERVPVDENGVISPEEIRKRLRPGTSLVAVIAAQNETGVLQPLDEIHEVTHAANVPLLVDAAQAIGRIDRDWTRGWDYLVVSGHKLRAPRGAAALVRRRGAKAPPPLLVGGGQELGRRAGTEDVAATHGLALALRRRPDLAALRAKRDRLEDKLVAGGSIVVARGVDRLPQTVSVLTPGRRSDDLLAALDLEGVAASAGSACSSGAIETSHVLAAMGVPDELARSVVRFSFGETTTPEELDEAAAIFLRIVGRS